MSQNHKDVLFMKDAILELPSKLADAINYVEHNEPDGSAEAERILVESYQGAIEFLFELGTWLTYIDEDAQSTRSIIESVVKEAILQNYDRSKAITCLTDDALSDTMEWLSQMVESPTWRQTIYELAQHPRNEDCPFLSLSMPCIAVKDNLIGELTSVPLAWNTLEIFLKCVAYVLQPLLAAGETIKDSVLVHSVAFLQPRKSGHSNETGGSLNNLDLFSDIDDLFTTVFQSENGLSLNEESGTTSDSVAKTLRQFLDMGCHSEHGYLILQSILQCLAARTKGYSARYLSWLLEAEASRRNRDVSRYSVYLCGARDYPESMDAMRKILRNQELVAESVEQSLEVQTAYHICLLRLPIHPRDFGYHIQTQLYASYKKEVCPPVNLLRQPIFVALLADALFASSDRLLAEQQEEYAYLYSYTAMTEETIEPTTDRRISSDSSRVEEAKQEVLKASRICRQWHNMSGSGVSLRAFRDLPALLACLNCRPVSFGVFRFVRVAFRTKRVDFEFNLDTMKPYCIVVNELAETNEHLHPALLAFVTELLASSVEGMEDLSQLECKRLLVGLLVQLLCCGYVLPVIRTMHRLFTLNRVDVSIARHFVTEVLKAAAPPYDTAFMAALHPLVTHPDISDGLKGGKDTEFVNEFLEYYEKEMSSGSNTD